MIATRSDHLPATTENKRRFEWAVCPGVESPTNRTFRLFVTKAEATDYWNAESEILLRSQAQQIDQWINENQLDPASTLATFLHSAQPREAQPSVRNRDQGMFAPVRIRYISDYPPGTRCDRSFQSFLTIQDIGTLPELETGERIRRALELRPFCFSTFLGDDWRFNEIDRDASQRVGHAYGGRKHSSVGEIVVKWLYDLEESLKQFWPTLSCSALADFWRSWQVHRHIAHFCERLGRSATTATLVANNLGVSELEAKKARQFAFVQIAAFALSVTGNFYPSEDSHAGKEESLPAGPAKGTTIGELLKESKAEVWLRRLMIVHNPRAKAIDLCESFDELHIPITSGWFEDFGVKNWIEAYKNEELRSRIDTMISKDRKCLNLRLSDLPY